MPKFVWEISSRGAWRPQLFHGELPREMTMPHNAGRYRVHDIKPADLYHAQTAAPSLETTVLEYLAVMFPAPVIVSEDKNVL